MSQNSQPLYADSPAVAWEWLNSIVPDQVDRITDLMSLFSIRAGHDDKEMAWYLRGKSGILIVVYAPFHVDGWMAAIRAVVEGEAKWPSSRR